MEKNIFDRMSDSYEQFHLQDSEIKKGNDAIVISPKLKLTLGWSIFVLCLVLACVFLGKPFKKTDSVSGQDKQAVLEKEIDVNEEHETIVPYEKDGDKELNAFIEKYFKAITDCDNVALQDMVTNPEQYANADSLKQKAEFITAYNNITVYTKEGLDEGSYVAFVISNLTINGVNSSPYDISALYIVNGARGYLINNGTLSADAAEYMEKVKGDEDIQAVYKAVEEKNNGMKEQDKSLQEFYDMLSQKQEEPDAAEDSAETEGESTQTPETEATTQAETTETVNTEAATAAEQSDETVQ